MSINPTEKPPQTPPNAKKSNVIEGLNLAETGRIEIIFEEYLGAANANNIPELGKKIGGEILAKGLAKNLAAIKDHLKKRFEKHALAPLAQRLAESISFGISKEEEERLKAARRFEKMTGEDREKFEHWKL